jgi:hypothetical protein
MRRWEISRTRHERPRVSDARCRLVFHGVQSLPVGAQQVVDTIFDIAP